MTAVAVLDVGKTNIKLSAVSRNGVIIETVSEVHNILSAPPYLHQDVAAIEAWCLGNLRDLVRRHAVDTLVATWHGSASLLVGDDGPILPIVDYENPVPPVVERTYREEAGPLEERGSPFVARMHHLAQQMLYFEMEWPREFAAARHFLGGPQYWGWRFTGVAATELTYLGAQSHLWDVRKRRWTAIVARRGWDRLLPPIVPAWQKLGTLKAELAARHGLPEGIAILCGIHDSSANFYRYQQAGFADLALISTGTFIVGLADVKRPEAFVVTERRMLCNVDVLGHPVAGALAMGGREFAIIAGAGLDRPADLRRVAALIVAGTMALPSFAEHDGAFPGSAGKGRFVGPAPASREDRRALAVLYSALVTDFCLDVMGENATTVLDGSFVKDPLYASLVAALRPGRRTLFSSDAYGTAAGAALLADHLTRTAPAPIDVRTPEAVHIPGLAEYRKDWRRLTDPGAVETKRVEQTT